MRRSTRHDGFTLIELLVVISVIAVLIAVLLPSLQKARETAKLVKCSSGVRGLGISTAVYQNDNRMYFPSPNFPGSATFFVGGLGVQKTLTDGGYTASPIWSNKGGCPDGPAPARWTAAFANQWNGGAEDYSDRIGYTFYSGTQGEITYGLNAVLVYGIVNGPTPSPGPFRDTFYRLQRHAEDTMTASCCSNIDCNAYFGVQLWHTMGIPGWYLSAAELAAGLPRHNGEGFNASFYDGHIAFKKATDLVPDALYPNAINTSIAWIQCSMSWYDLSVPGIDHP